MTNENNTNTDANPVDEAAALAAMPDPRPDHWAVTEAVGRFIRSVEETAGDDVLAGPTPCPEFTVAALLDHVVMAADRIAVIGRGQHFSDAGERTMDRGWADAFDHYAEEAKAAWGDPAVLGTELEVPWGKMPGGAILPAYTGEFAVHAWDLAVASSQNFALDDDALGGALFAASFIPADGRGTPDIPFGPIVDPGQDASALDRLAGLMGRDVIGVGRD